MNVGKLIEILSQYDEDLPVTIAIQPRYPIRLAFRGVYHRDEPLIDERSPEPEEIILVASDQHPDGNPYGEHEWWDAAER